MNIALAPQRDVSASMAAIFDEGSSPAYFTSWTKIGASGRAGRYGPKLAYRVEICVEFDSGLTEPAAERLCGVDGEEHSVDSYGLSVGEPGAYPFGDGGHFGLAFFHDCDAWGAGDLCGGLQPVAGVGPYVGFCRCDYERSGRSGESGEPSSHLPVVGYVFALVWVGLGNIAASMPLDRIRSRSCLIMAVVLFLISMGGHARAWLRCKCSDYFCGRQQMKLIDGGNRSDNQVKMLF